MLASTRSAFTGHAVAARPVVAFAPRRAFSVVENAHKKGAGSTKNGRDSNAQRRGVKVYGGQEVKAGGIIIRQVGSQWYAGDNTGTGRDFTIFSTVDGVVIFEKKRNNPKIHVYPLDHPKAQAEVAKTHTTAPKEGVASRQARRKTQYTSRKSGSTVGVATVAASPLP